MDLGLDGSRGPHVGGDLTYLLVSTFPRPWASFSNCVEQGLKKLKKEMQNKDAMNKLNNAIEEMKQTEKDIANKKNKSFI